MDLTGYFWLIFKDKNQIEPFEKFNIPLYAFKAFQPIHLEIQCRNPESQQKCKIYLSLTLERVLLLFLIPFLAYVKCSRFTLQCCPQLG